MGRSTLAQQQNVGSTVHNLSVSGPGEVKSFSETELCKFCHIPHNASVPAPLWGHELSRASYKVPTVGASTGKSQLAPQPDGSSKLCLSCHDGTVALGEIAGMPRAITMSGSQRLSPGQRGFLGTDLSGSHPISFTLADFVDNTAKAETDIGMRPMALIAADPDVRLDSQGKMQCTTCHDPHSDRYFQEGRTPHFWVKPTVGEVCTTCHELL